MAALIRVKSGKVSGTEPVVRQVTLTEFCEDQQSREWGSRGRSQYGSSDRKTKTNKTVPYLLSKQTAIFGTAKFRA